jgi:flagellar biogenesis protein FliO
MKSMPKWFLIPPAVAALLILGTLSMQPGGKAVDKAVDKGIDKADTSAKSDARAERSEAAPTAAPAAAPAARAQPTLPRAPDLAQVIPALVGVLLLGVGGVWLLRRLRHGPRAGGTASLLALRQTLRLSARQAVHAIEFDDRILLIGASERGLALLDSGRLPERAADEHDVLARATDDDDGAVPKNLVIPRPAGAPARRLPTPPATATAREPARAAPGLADFRNLLQKVGRA